MGRGGGWDLFVVVVFFVFFCLFDVGLFVCFLFVCCCFLCVFWARGRFGRWVFVLLFYLSLLSFYKLDS